MSSRHPAQAETLGEIAAALIEEAPDGTEFAGAVETLDGFAPYIQDLAPCGSFRSSLGVEEAGHNGTP